MNKPNTFEVSIEDGGWDDVVGPSDVAYSKRYKKPHELDKEQIKGIIQDFVSATIRADKAGFDIIEIHGAHGYLMSSFLSPKCNFRRDEYGGSFENRIKFPLEVTKAVRDAWPSHKPLIVRISCSDWTSDGWSVDDSVKLAHKLKELGVDVVDCSSGGNTPEQKIVAVPGYQVPFSAKLRREANIPTCAVGMLTQPKQCEEILQKGEADIICLARELLRDPFWPLRAASALGVQVEWVPQYERAKM
eukprot:TRINITY_DN1431_c0_g1_i2.p1 TRINITY_DN1431_c0_g1~~TRINITY_DN1431_c0_g1_i2.p1  ORF type:complete len:246 (+),score=48.62 TRINITY_DN1431_c0_g1_i2:517-1254(+)